MSPRTRTTPAKARPAGRIIFYRDARNEWRWQARAANGNIVADGAEGYQRSRDALRGLAATMAAMARGRIVGLIVDNKT